MDLGTAAVSIGSAVIASGGIAWVGRALARRGSAEIMERINKSAGSQVDQFQERAAKAEATADRTEAKLERANTEIDLLRGKVRGMEETVARVTRKLNWLIDSIHEPQMTVTRLRVMVPLSPPGQNGSS